MPTTRARLLLTVSVLLLVAVAVAWSVGGVGAPRADLEGDEVRGPSVAEVRGTATLPSISTTAAPQPSAPTTTAAPVRPAAPVRVSIPSLSVDAPIVPVGLEDDGSMEIPGASEAGWYRHGATPGDADGSAVIAAHVDYEDEPGVFLELRRLELGSEVVVTDETGTPRRFVVSERFQVAKGELPVEELFRSSGQPSLTLVTCGGEFNSRARDYADNVVVRALPA